MLRFDHFATGPRMGLKVALALEAAGLLKASTSTHGYPPVGRPGWRSESWGHVRGTASSTGLARARFTLIRNCSCSTVSRRAHLAGRDLTILERLVVRDFRFIARQCSSPAVFGMQSCCVELFEGRRRARSWNNLLRRLWSNVVSQKRSSDGEPPGWTHDRVSSPTRWDDRNVQEWNAADIIWAPSPYVVELCEQEGADRSKLRMVRYPIPSHPRAAARAFHRGRTLRVLFAGTLMLRKGVQYIYEALRGWNNPRIDMHFFGPHQLTDTGVGRLAKIGTLHGPLSRAELLDEFIRSDVLLFPSVSEGSALVMAEAVGTGLPVIATEESGPPDSAMVIEARSPEAIRAALESILDEPGSLEVASRKCLEEADRRSPKSFNGELAALAKESLQLGARNSPAAQLGPVADHPDRV